MDYLYHWSNGHLTSGQVKDVTVHIGTEITGLQLKDLTDQQRVCGLLTLVKTRE